MAFDVSFLPDPENRSASDWFVFWARLYDAVAVQGQSVTVNGRTYTSHNLADIVSEKEKAEAKYLAASMSKAQRHGPIYLG